MTCFWLLTAETGMTKPKATPSCKKMEVGDKKMEHKKYERFGTQKKYTEMAVHSESSPLSQEISNL